MRGVKIGYVFTLSFLLVLAGLLLTTGFYKAPEAPEPPEYPTYEREEDSFDPTPTPTPFVFSTPTPTPTRPIIQPQPLPDTGGPGPIETLPPNQINSLYAQGATQDYFDDLEQYQRDMEQYEEDLENYTKDKMLPYMRNISIIWLSLLIIATSLGVLLMRIGASTVGAAYALVGAWVFLLAPVGLMIFAMSSFIAAYARGSESNLAVEPITQAVGWTAAIGVVILTIIGLLLLDRLSIPRRAQVNQA